MPHQTPTGHLDSMRGLGHPACLTWRIATIFVGIWRQYLCVWRASMFAEICRQYLSVCQQSSICLSCSPIRGRQSYFVWRSRASNRSLCCGSKIFLLFEQIAFHTDKGISWRFLSYLFVCLWEICLPQMFTENISEKVFFWAVWCRMIEKNLEFEDVFLW